MIITAKHKIIAIALAAALFGGSVGAIVLNSVRNREAATTNSLNDSSAAQPLVTDPSRQGLSLVSAQPTQEYLSGAQQTYVPSVATRTVYHDRYVREGRTGYYGRSYQRPSFWHRHRDILTVGIGAGAGALIGGIAGGGKGSAIGALVGGGGGALYTYKLRKRHSYDR